MTRVVVFGVVLALLTWWLHRRLVRATGLTRPWSVVVDVVLVVLWVLAVIGAGSGEVFDTGWARPPGFVGWVWLGALLYLVLGLLLVAIGSLVVRVVARFRHRSESAEQVDLSRRRTLRLATSVVAVGAVVAAGYGVAEAARPRVVRVRVPLRRLPPEFEGVRVALVSDLHVGPARGVGFTREVVDVINAQEPDLVAIVGDLVDGTVSKVAPDLEPLADLRAPMGIFGVSGNHEFYADDGGRWLDVWDRLGIATLRNQRVALRRGDATIDIAGIHDYSSPTPYEPDLSAALAGRDPSTFVMLLAHEPRQALEASDLGVDLQLSGHTHGGQMWPLRYLVPLQQPSVTGLDRIGKTVLYTTRGVGAWGPPVRVAAPPEITILELVRAD
ncbi:MULTISPECIES: metallophosphoesterase [Rhodococcus]|uniref:Metallophosphoesterase n=1 Tax=Rhodococcus oxybenzonivorans TaxID=1990687 RepID=A0AAE4V186_9NOCA|nr:MULTISPECIES: metallophosphoesterase [Rhodococcus]MDV7242082.1 metallophosphoesterase [Rhodococcus oxybenzonivorans]MDV7266024.1 metallophosphoesterase [Rhodococcus oxybenzonivorans]MDV7276423.1 metallophosphoesterase [Rhodococcus oxybenzonivorans]MDV7331570.1 metallophosphoesterase [Rhodococcus oxybenzonivorans]MDV7343792.1 metallophosphoesterase [Rhodococcus oxybenzonivorans]